MSILQVVCLNIGHDQSSLESRICLSAYAIQFCPNLEAKFLDVIGKSLKGFPPCYSQSPLLTDFFLPPPPPPPSKSGLKLVCNVNTVCGNLKSENSRLCTETSTKLYVHEFGFRTYPVQVIVFYTNLLYYRTNTVQSRICLFQYLSQSGTFPLSIAQPRIRISRILGERPKLCTQTPLCVHQQKDGR